MIRVYIAGPIESAGGNMNIPLFDQWAEELRRLGCDVFNPIDFARERLGPNFQKDFDKATFKRQREQLLKHEIIWIFNNKPNVIFLLPGWERSTGASLERATGIALNLTIREAPLLPLPIYKTLGELMVVDQPDEV